MPEQITPETPANEPGNAPEQASAAQVDQANQTNQPAQPAQAAPAPAPAPAPTPTTAPAQPQPSQQTSGLAVAGLVLGIIAVATSFVPIVNNASFFLGIIGLALAIAGNINIKKTGKKGQGIAIAGIVLGIVSIVIVLLMQSMCAAILSSATSSRSSASASTSAASTAADSGAAAGGAASESAAASNNASSGAASSSAGASDSEFEVTIDEARIAEDYNGDPVIVVHYTWTNNSDDTRSFASSLHPKCFQDGVQLDTAIVRDVDSKGFISDVRPGYGTSVELAYKLNGSSSVEVEVTKLASLDKTVLASQTFELS